MLSYYYWQLIPTPASPHVRLRVREIRVLVLSTDENASTRAITRSRTRRGFASVDATRTASDSRASCRRRSDGARLVFVGVCPRARLRPPEGSRGWCFRRARRGAALSRTRARSVPSPSSPSSPWVSASPTRPRTPRTTTSSTSPPPRREPPRRRERPSASARVSPPRTRARIPAPAVA